MALTQSITQDKNRLEQELLFKGVTTSQYHEANLKQETTD